jgi:hypothetical protein
MKAPRIADLYSDYLLASFGATTATGLSELLEGELSHDQVTRYLAGPQKTARDLWQTVKAVVRDVQSAAGVLIIDDSIEEKPYTDENDIVCWHYDHSKDRLLKGINFLTALYQSQDVSVRSAFTWWPRPRSIAISRRRKRSVAVRCLRMPSVTS